MMEQSLAPRNLVYHAAEDAFGPRTQEIMTRLGYTMSRPEEYEDRRVAESLGRPDLLLVDERRLSEADAYEDGGEDSIPIVLLSGRHGATGADPRIVGAVKRPAGMHDLYRLMQQVFEDTPRSTPRIATQLRATCLHGERHWQGRVLSLSENGCLIRSPEPILLGSNVQLELALPQRDPVRLDAEAAYQLLPDVGLVFSAVEPSAREALEEFVQQTLLAA